MLVVFTIVRLLATAEMNSLFYHSTIKPIWLCSQCRGCIFHFKITLSGALFAKCKCLNWIDLSTNICYQTTPDTHTPTWPIIKHHHGNTGFQAELYIGHISIPYFSKIDLQITLCHIWSYSRHQKTINFLQSLTQWRVWVSGLQQLDLKGRCCMVDSKRWILVLLNYPSGRCN